MFQLIAIYYPLNVQIVPSLASGNLVGLALWFV